MSYQSVDSLQKALADNIFSDRTDTKKAAGRALGTIVELLTFYIIRSWGFQNNLSIERGLAEFANDIITHNVEFGLHSNLGNNSIRLPKDAGLPLSPTKIVKFSEGVITKNTNNQLLSSKNILRNACTIYKDNELFTIATLVGSDEKYYYVETSNLNNQPFAMVECKRVGVEDGATKGPTTIEKAKQGAYVAKHLSSLQKIRDKDGRLYGATPKGDGTFIIKPLADELKRLVFDEPLNALEGFIMTIGIVSNHGNWFTQNNMNKELLVLKDSYDWLLFLTDHGISQFVHDTLLTTNDRYKPIRNAFEQTYKQSRKGPTRFTKVQIDFDAHICLCRYFEENIKQIESNWFNTLSPENSNISELKKSLSSLVGEKMKPCCSYIDLFAGAGGWSVGLDSLGYQNCGMYDHNESACKTALYNFGEVVSCLDLSVADPSDLPEVEIIFGSPPCQGFSNEGKKNQNDPRNSLIWSYFNIIKKKKPRVWVFENVPGFKRSYGGKFYKEAMNFVEKLPYKVSSMILDTANYGVPQHRKRFIMIGALDFQPNIPEPSHAETYDLMNLDTHVTLWNAISDLPTPTMGDRIGEFSYNKNNRLTKYQQLMRNGSKKIYNHTAQKHSERVLNKIRMVPKGGDMSNFIENFEENTTHYCGGYRRAEKESPSWTAYWTRGMTSIHPEEDRFLTPRECARIQSFPDSFIFKGTTIENYTQVCNAVPPLLSQSIGLYIANKLMGKGR